MILVLICNGLCLPVYGLQKRDTVSGVLSDNTDNILKPLQIKSAVKNI